MKREGRLREMGRDGRRRGDGKGWKESRWEAREKG